MEPRARQDAQTLVSRGLGSAGVAVGQGAGERRDDVVGGSALVLFGVGVGELQDVAGIL
jgi:hypothetical protein